LRVVFGYSDRLGRLPWFSGVNGLE
jgi:hypothetical protein